MTNKKTTVGKKSKELSQKESPTRDPIELEREMHKSYEEELWECVDFHKKKLKGDFFVVVITKKERLMQNVLRNYFFARTSCPTPDYDQTVYRYIKDSDELEFLWILPAKDICHVFLFNAHQVVPEERWLLEYIKEFSNGSLMKLCKKFNQENQDSPLLVSS